MKKKSEETNEAKTSLSFKHKSVATDCAPSVKDRLAKETPGKENDYSEELQELEKEESLSFEKETPGKENNYLEDLQRVQAEFENYMKRVEKERVLLGDFAKRDLLLKVLQVMDEFEVALAAFGNADDKQEIVKGVEMLHHHLQKILESEQVRKVESLGKLADSSYHDVIAQAEGENGVVVEEVKKGYMVKDKLLRASIVKVGNGLKKEGEGRENV